jgi:hypothetical protein
MNEVLKAMLMTKLKTYLATALVAVLLAAGGLAYRAAGQPPAGQAPAGGAPGAGGGGLPAAQAPLNLKGSDDRGTGRGPRAGGRPLTEIEILRREVEILKLQVDLLRSELRDLQSRRGAAGPQAKPGSGAADNRLDLGGRLPAVDGSRNYLDAAKQAEDALRALRGAKDAAARRRAVDALDRALRGLREQLRRPADTAPRPEPGVEGKKSA